MQRTKRALGHLAAILFLPLVVGALGIGESLRRNHPEPLPPASPELLAQAGRPDFDPTRPTVVVLLGADLTEITDALGPYEIFSRLGGHNVVTAAPERRPTVLTGGLRVLPHYSLAELDARLAGRVPAIVVVPNVPNIAEPQNAALVAWIRARTADGALMHSWCTGAMALAEAGVLDGRTATAHWGDLATLEDRYPRVRWVRGVRWVEHEDFVMSAGITSGIDASLRVIVRLAGEDEARRVAREIRYPGIEFALDPRVVQHEIEPADAILLADLAYGGVDREHVGLALYPGVGELDLSNVYDTHALTRVADVESIGQQEIVHTAHGLALLPAIALSARALPALDRVLVPGPTAREDARDLADAARASDIPVQYLHAGEPDRFGLAPVIEDLARTSDVATARFALRRMEHRGSGITLDGPTLRPQLLAVPLALGALGALGALALRILGRRRARIASGRR